MTKSAKELYAVPDWMRPYLPLFQNTGGNDVEELLHDDNTSMFANSIRYMLIVSARSQFTLLMGLHELGFLSTVSDAFLAEVRAQARNEGINYAASRLAAAFNHGFVDKPLAEVYDVVCMILDTKEELANSTLPAEDGLSGEYAEEFIENSTVELRKGVHS